MLPIMPPTVINLSRYRTKAFTLLESLVTLTLVVFLTLLLSGSVRLGFEQMAEQVFLMEFEHLYLTSQQQSVLRQEGLVLTITQDGISNGERHLALPATVTLADELVLTLSDQGGNSSLKRVQFYTSSQVVTYQLQLGSGRYRKNSQSLHSP